MISFRLKLALLISFCHLTLLGVSNGQGLFAKKATTESLNPNDEYIIISGGPALLKWESYRRDEHKHDRWWGNFVRTARLRISELQEASKNTAKITWLVYRRGYESRTGEDGVSLISNIESVRDKFKVNLVWYDTGDDIINYLNSGVNRSLVKVSGLEYFGHSNRYCFLLDYSNNNLGTSRAYIHQRDLMKINREIFAKNCYCKSWGCYSGESFTSEFKKATGKKMIGAIGKTDYSDTWKMTLPVLSPGGRWVY